MARARPAFLNRQHEAALEELLRSDRMIIGATLAIATFICWLYLLSLPATHSGYLDIDDVLMTRPAIWSLKHIAFVLVMWSVMMVGMMLPSAARAILLYAYVGRQRAADAPPFAPSFWFVLGYLAAWLAFSALATFAQCVLDSAGLLNPMMASASLPLSGALLLAAGLYQMSPLKEACLARRQAPLRFIERHGGFRADARGAALLGLHHGVDYVRCCWALMALLFVGGVMNVLWMAVLALYMLVEKFVSRGLMLSRVSGAALVVAGVVVLFNALH